jgi:hypothetical protein
MGWAYNEGYGALFFMLHVMGTAQGAGMIRNVFIKNEKAKGWF